MLKAKLLGVVLLSVCTVAAYADNDDDERGERSERYEKRGPMPFEVFDLNSDGVVTQQEYEQVRVERQQARSEKGYPMRNATQTSDFDQMDADANGSISREELDAWRAQKMMQKRGVPVTE